MSEKLTLREKLHAGEKPHMSKKLKKTLIVIACVIAGCGAVWGGLTIGRNAQRGDVNVYAVNDFAMTNYWGDTSNTSGMVTTDKLQKIYISQSQTVKKVWVKEGDTVKKGTALVSYDSTLTQATVERAKIDYDRQAENLEVMKNELALLQKAKNKETLQAELKKAQDELEKAIKDDPSSAVDETKITAPENITPKDTETPGSEAKNPFFILWPQEKPLNDEAAKDILALLNKPIGEANTKVDVYVVLVTRSGDIKGGLLDNQWGIRITGQYTAGAEGSEGQPATEAKTEISMVLMTPKASFSDPEKTYSETVTKLQRKVEQIQELVDASMTQLEINKAILEKAQAVKEQEVNLKVAKLKLDKKLAELGDGNVYAEFDGTVKAVRDPDEAYNNSEAVVELSGGGGYYVTGTLSEMDLGSVQVGDSVSISSWMTGAACEGTIVSIDDYPTSNGNNWGDGNSNVSYYPFKVFVTEDANLQPNDYVDIQYQKDTSAEESGSSLYLQSMFIREDNGKSYVMARGEDGRLEQRWVQTGRDLWGSYTQIRGGLTIDDYVAFPYGRDVTEGAKTVEATADQLYNYGV